MVFSKTIPSNSITNCEDSIISTCLMLAQNIILLLKLKDGCLTIRLYDSVQLKKGKLSVCSFAVMEESQMVFGIHDQKKLPNVISVEHLIFKTCLCVSFNKRPAFPLILLIHKRNEQMVSSYIETFQLKWMISLEETSHFSRKCFVSFALQMLQAGNQNHLKVPEILKLKENITILLV